MQGGLKEAGAVIALLVLAGCERELSPEEQARLDERDIAMVEQANESMPPIERLTPEPLLNPDIERYDLYGAACNYAPGTSLGTRVLAREADAFMKVEGEVLRFAADPGARELPQRTRSLYNGREHVLRLQVAEDSTETGETGEQAANLEGSVTVFDKHGRVVYEGAGLVQCRS